MTKRHYPWDVLGIDETDEKKSIKKAYAVSIKQYKPDENPEKFKKIQEAYKYALQTLSFNNLRHLGMNLSGVEKDSFLQYNFDEISNKSEKNRKHGLESEKEAKFQILQEEIVDNLLEQLHVVAHSSIEFKNKVENWSFFEKFYKIDNLNKRQEVAQTVFKKVAVYNSDQIDINNTLLIHPRILQYFNKIFQWSENSRTYQDIFPSYYFDVTFNYFENKIKQVYIRNLFDSYSMIFKRFFALLFDLVFGFIYTLLFVAVTYKFYDYQNMSEIELKLIYLVIFSLYYLLSEILPDYRSSIGKKLSYLILTDNYGNKPLITTILYRHLIINIVFIPIIYLPLLGLGLSTESLTALIIFIVVNLYSLIIKRGFLHDIITRSMVIHKENPGSIYFSYEQEIKIRRLSRYKY